jgi:hypothetical protein
LKNLPELVAQVYQSLTHGGSFVFSVEHPIYTSPRNPKFIVDDEARQVWLLDSYLTEGSTMTKWFADGVIKQHRKLDSFVTILLKAGFILSDLDEWGPNLEASHGKPSVGRKPRTSYVPARKSCQTSGIEKIKRKAMMVRRVKDDERRCSSFAKD